MVNLANFHQVCRGAEIAVRPLYLDRLLSTFGQRLSSKTYSFMYRSCAATSLSRLYVSSPHVASLGKRYRRHPRERSPPGAEIQRPCCRCQKHSASPVITSVDSSRTSLSDCSPDGTRRTAPSTEGLRSASPVRSLPLFVDHLRVPIGG